MGIIGVGYVSSVISGNVAEVYVKISYNLFTSVMICYQPIANCSHLCYTGPRSAVGNVSGYRCVSDCRSRGREFDPGPVPYFRGD